MRNWRVGCTAAALVLALAGCAGHEEPAAIDGRVDILPADNAKTEGSGSGKGPDPGGLQTQPSKQECALAVAASNALLSKHVLAIFPAKALRQVEPMRAADTFHCDPREGPDFGGVMALWREITGAEAIKLLEQDGWARTDPKEGEPAWAKQGLKHGDGSLNLEPAEKYIVTFTAERGARTMWMELTQDGLRAGLD